MMTAPENRSGHACESEKMMGPKRHCFESGVRQSMHAFPAPLQWLLTWITGKPLQSDEPRLVLPIALDVLLTPLLLVLTFVSLIQLATSISLLAIPAIPALWLLAVGLLRKMQVTHLHHAIHNRLFTSPVLNQLYADLVPALIFVQNGGEYRKEHLVHHNLKFFSTRHDADADFLSQLGFVPGRTCHELWNNLWMTIFSPVLHILFLRARFGSLLLRAKPGVKALTLVMVGLHALLLVMLEWKVYLLAVAMPMFVLYHVSALMQFLTEHAWNVTGGPVRDWAEYKARCWGRFCGEPYPQRYFRAGNQGDFLIGRLHRFALVMGWAVRMIFMHFTVRVSCLVSDLPAHDWHHLAHLAGQNSRDWRQSLYLREAAIANGDRPGFNTRELWGMHAMIEHQFLWLESIVCQYVLPETEHAASSLNHVFSPAGKPE